MRGCPAGRPRPQTSAVGLCQGAVYPRALGPVSDVQARTPPSQDCSGIQFDSSCKNPVTTQGRPQICVIGPKCLSVHTNNNLFETIKASQKKILTHKPTQKSRVPLLSQFCNYFPSPRGRRRNTLSAEPVIYASCTVDSLGGSVG